MELYQQIGQLKVELDWLKKKAGLYFVPLPISLPFESAVAFAFEQGFIEKNPIKYKSFRSAVAPTPTSWPTLASRENRKFRP
jgi:hypothetical protein